MDDQHSTDLFLQACEATSAVRLEVVDARTGETRRWSFPRPYVVIGREDGAGLLLNDPDVSRRHAYLQVVRGRIFCVDLASRTGIRWGTNLERAGWLGRDQPVEIGPFLVRPCEDEPERPFVQAALPDVELELWEGSAWRAHWRVERVLALIGRSSACNLQLANPEVPRFLCGLLRTPLGAWIVDLEGSGVSVNDRPVPFARIEDGDLLRAGPYAIHIGCPAAVAAQAGTVALEPPAGRPTARAIVARTPLHGPGTWPAPSVPAPARTDDSLLFDLRDELSRVQPQTADQFGPSMMMMARAFGTLFQEQMQMVREELDQIRQLTRELEALRSRLQEAGSPARIGLAAAPPPSGLEAKLPRPEAAAGLDNALPPQEGLDDLHAMLCRRIATFQEERDTRWQKLVGAVLGR